MSLIGELSDLPQYESTDGTKGTVVLNDVLQILENRDLL